MSCVVCVVWVGAVGGWEGEGEGRGIDNDGGCCTLSAVMCGPSVARNTRRNLWVEQSRNNRWCLRRLVSTLIPVMCVVCGVYRVVCVAGGWGGGKGGRQKGREASTMMGGCCALSVVMCEPSVVRNTQRNIWAEYSRNGWWCLRRLVSNVIPVVCVCGVWCVSCWMCGVGGWWDRADNGVSVMDPMCCGV